MKMTKRVAIYCRVSTTEQTLEQQRKPLVDLCEQKNWLYDIFEEKISGAKTDRPELKRMMEAIRAREFNAVLVLKLDRLGRSLQHIIQLVQEFNNKKVQFMCVSPEIDTKSAQGMFFLQIIGAVAELERNLIRERTKAKLDLLKSQGVRLGRPPGSKDKKPRCVSGYHMRWRDFKRYKLSKLNKMKFEEKRKQLTEYEQYQEEKKQINS